MQPGEVFARGMAAGPDQLGATVVRTFLEAWEPPETRVRLMAMLRSAITNEAAMGMIRDLLVREVFGPITAALGVPDAQLRATLVGSQFIGLAVMRYIGRIEPLASALDRRARRGDRTDGAAVPDGGPRDGARRAGSGAARRRGQM